MGVVGRGWTVASRLSGEGLAQEGASERRPQEGPGGSSLWGRGWGGQGRVCGKSRKLRSLLTLCDGLLASR